MELKRAREKAKDTREFLARLNGDEGGMSLEHLAVIVLDDRIKELEADYNCLIISRADMQDRVDELEQGCRLLINIIPDDWAVPILYGSAVAQVKELLEENE